MEVDPQLQSPACQTSLSSWTDEEIHQSISARFEKQAFNYPDHLAVVSEQFQWSYRELQDHAKRCAHYLHSLKTTSPVALLMDHNAPLIAAMLGVLQSGAICVVLSHTYPEARIKQILDDAMVTTIITDSQHVALSKRIGGDQRVVIGFDEIPPVTPNAAPTPPVASDRPAFIVYTSGTTGKPRGVVQLHRNILHNVRRHTLGMRFTHEDNICLLSYCSAGQGMATAFCALLNGATLFPMDIARSGLADIADWLDENSISVFVASASIFRHFVAILDGRRVLSGIRMVRLASETVRFSDYFAFTRCFGPHCAFANTYSSTETGNISQYHLPNNPSISGEDIMPIGSAADGIEVLLWDESGQAVADGEIGEIVVKSNYNSPGYWNNQEQNRISFITHPGSETTCYRTRDLARRLPDGNLVHLGRTDDQIKIRGFRINPGEIAGHLLQYPMVRDAVIDTRTDSIGDIHLVAYLLIHPESPIDIPELRAYLRAILSEHMVPSRFIQLEEFPRTPNGKWDKSALRQIQSAPSPQQNQATETASELQSLVTEIFCSLLDLDYLGIDESFFDAGGDSLLVTQLLCQIESSTGLSIPIIDFFAMPTIAGVEAVIRRRQKAGDTLSPQPMVPANHDLPLPLSYAQERSWKYSQDPESSLGYMVCSVFRILGPLEPDVFQSCIEEIVRRHASLRTTFPLKNDQPYQLIHPPAKGACSYEDFSDHPNPEDHFESFWRQEKVQPINLAIGPVFRSGLVRLSPTLHHYYMCVHHIVWDSWSRGNLFKELGELYAAFIEGRPSPLPENTLQYADFAAWQKQYIHVQSPLFQHQLAYWKQNLTGVPRSMDLHMRRDDDTPVPSSADCTLRWEYTEKEKQFIDQTKRAVQATFFMTQLSLLAHALHHLTGIEDVVIGSYLTNRSRPETLGMIGFFSNLVAFRINLSGNPDLPQVLERVKATTLDAATYGDIPYEELSAALWKENCIPPEIQIILGIGHRDHTTESAGITWTQLKRVDSSMPWGIQFNVNFEQDKLTGRISFDGNLYDPKKMSALIAAYRDLLVK